MKQFGLISVFFINYLIGQQNSTVYLIFNDSELTYQDLNRKVNFLIDNSNASKMNFEIIHFSTNSESLKSWKHKKNNLSYKPSLSDCSFNLCQSVASIFNATRTTESQIFLSDKSLKCEFGIPTVQMPNKDESTISEKLKSEFSRIKSLKTNQNIYFIFSSERLLNTPKFNFDQPDITIKDGQSIELKPELSGSFKTFEWSPKINLSCSDCQNPIASPKETTVYTLTAIDSSGCHSVSKSIEVKVEKSCFCEREIGQIEIQFGKLPIQKFEKKNPALTAEWDWRIISNQSGLYVFDLITNSGCAKKFRLKVKTASEEVIYDEIYLAEDVDKRSNMPYHNKYPENFVFRVDLSDYHIIKRIEDVENIPFFTVEIIPFDDNDQECLSRKYVSPKLRPTKCH